MQRTYHSAAGVEHNATHVVEAVLTSRVCDVEWLGAVLQDAEELQDSAGDGGNDNNNNNNNKRKINVNDDEDDNDDDDGGKDSKHRSVSNIGSSGGDGVVGSKYGSSKGGPITDAQYQRMLRQAKRRAQCLAHPDRADRLVCFVCFVDVCL